VQKLRIKVFSYNFSINCSKLLKNEVQTKIYLFKKDKSFLFLLKLFNIKCTLIFANKNGDNLKKFLLLNIILILLISCSPKVDPKYKKEVDDWHKDRLERLKNPDGWLSLAGLYWLKEGENTFGSDSSNDVIFPKWKAKPFLGSFFLDSGKVTVKMNYGFSVKNKGSKVSEILMINDMEGNPTVLKFGSLSWNIIKRSGNMYGVRLRDSQNPLIKNLKTIQRFDVNPEWRIDADFHPYSPPQKIAIPNIIGTIDEEASPGYLEFIYDGKKYKVDVLNSGSNLFLIFADLTNGEETYGAGRFLLINRPAPNGKTIIDFNKAYNPPCAFTKYATCPLPPKQNKLKLRIEAGEKKYGNH